MDPKLERKLDEFFDNHAPRIREVLDEIAEDRRNGISPRRLKEDLDDHHEEDDDRFEDHGSKLNGHESRLAVVEAKVNGNISGSWGTIPLPSAAPSKHPSVWPTALVKLIANPKMIPVYIALASTCSYMAGHMHGTLQYAVPTAQAHVAARPNPTAEPERAP